MEMSQMCDPANPDAAASLSQSEHPSHQNKEIKLPLGTIAYTECGEEQGPPLILLHANPGDSRDYDDIILQLAKQYRVFAIDWPGYGHSRPLRVTASAQLYAQVLSQFTTELRITKAIVIGNSVGAYAAVRLALEKPDHVRALVLVSPAGFTDLTWWRRLAIRIRGTTWGTRLFGYRLATRYLRCRTDLVRAILERVRDEGSKPERRAVDAAIWRSLGRPETDLRAKAERIAVPVFLVFGYQDPLVRLHREGRAALAAMPGARCVAMHTGHEPFAEDPEAFLAAVDPFLSLVSVSQAMQSSAACRGIIFVHGVGSQDKSQTLLDFTVPLLQWLHHWSAANGTSLPGAKQAVLGFTPFDSGHADRPSHVTITLGNGDTWLCAEGWWSHSTIAPGFEPMLLWLSKSVQDVLAQLGRAMWQRVTGEAGDGSPSPTNSLLRFLDNVYAVIMGALFALGLILAYPLLAFLVLVGQLPIDILQNWVFDTALRAFLEINVAEMRILLEDPVQGANIGGRLARSIHHLVDQGCTEVIIVAHSGGAVASFAMLTDPDPYMRETALHVKKLITLGCGLNKGWLLSPEADCLRRTLPAHIHWLDIWATYDPVPAGWLDPSPASRGWPCYVPIFRPSDEVTAKQRYSAMQRRRDPNPFGRKARELATGTGTCSADEGPVRWPASLEVTNTMSPISDHGGYMSNYEQVVTRLIAEIDAEYYKDSPFWRGAQPAAGELADQGLQRAIAMRRLRVGVLAGIRLAVAVAVLALIVWLEVGLLRADGVAGLRVDVNHVPQQATLAHQLAGGLARIGDVAGALKTLPVSLMGALVIALVGFTCYNLYRLLFWVPRDARDQDRRVLELATAAGPLTVPMLYPGGLTGLGQLITFRFPPRPPIVRPFFLLRLVALLLIVLIVLVLV
jgi:pimeloyl-ACP methyl ester carboxylesterase